MSTLQTRYLVLFRNVSAPVRNCENCRFVNVAVDTTGPQLECRRYPPNPDFPRIEPTDWCGEHSRSPDRILTELLKDVRDQSVSAYRANQRGFRT